MSSNSNNGLNSGIFTSNANNAFSYSNANNMAHYLVDIKLYSLSLWKKITKLKSFNGFSTKPNKRYKKINKKYKFIKNKQIYIW